MYGLYSRAASNQERLLMARVRYLPGLVNVVCERPLTLWGEIKKFWDNGDLYLLRAMYLKVATYNQIYFDKNRFNCTFDNL